VASGAAILGLSLVTRYPLGAIKLVSFPTHGVIEALAGAATALAPWTLGFSKNRCATLTHMASGIGTLAVVAITDYQAAEGRYGRYRRGERGAGLAEQIRGQEEVLQELEKTGQVDVGPETHVPRTAWTGRPM
ncbi:MAG TPA: SPW repeat protein, partial [Blastocatellia bacterium]|nr:SPW repeat protein [Blastocatellia bacterium]